MNFQLQRRTDLALAALRHLAGEEARVSRSDLADSIGSTPTFLPQVMAPLIEAGWVTSERGPGGGYVLDPAAHEATLLDVVEATEGREGPTRCLLRDAPCSSDHPCAVHEPWNDAKRVLLTGFSQIQAIQSLQEETK